MGISIWKGLTLRTGYSGSNVASALLPFRRTPVHCGPHHDGSSRFYKYPPVVLWSARIPLLSGAKQRQNDLISSKWHFFGYYSVLTIGKLGLSHRIPRSFGRDMRHWVDRSSLFFLPPFPSFLLCLPPSPFFFSSFYKTNKELDRLVPRITVRAD